MSVESLGDLLKLAHEKFSEVNHSKQWKSTHEQRSIVSKLVQLGATHKEIFDVTGISQSALNKWISGTPPKQNKKTKHFKTLQIFEQEPKEHRPVQKNTSVRITFKNGVMLDLEQSCLNGDFLEKLNLIGGVK